MGADYRLYNWPDSSKDRRDIRHVFRVVRGIERCTMTFVNIATAQDTILKARVNALCVMVTGGRKMKSMSKRDIKAKRWLKHRVKREEGAMWHIAMQLNMVAWGRRERSSLCGIEGYSRFKDGAWRKYVVQSNRYIR